MRAGLCDIARSEMESGAKVGNSALWPSPLHLGRAQRMLLVHAGGQPDCLPWRTSSAPTVPVGTLLPVRSRQIPPAPRWEVLRRPRPPSDPVEGETLDPRPTAG